MAKKLSFARRRPREEEAELNTATPDDSSQDGELLSPASAQLLREALQAEADAGIASSLVCPITNELMTDPVFTLDGQVSPTPCIARCRVVRPDEPPQSPLTPV